MNNKNDDLWLNIYTFVLIPFCIIINIINTYNGFKYYDAYDNKVISFFTLAFAIISVIYFAITFYYAMDRKRLGYNLILVSVGYSVVVSSFNQVVATYLGQGTKFYVMFIVYGILFTIFWGLPNYLYFIKRKNLFETKKINEETKEKIKKELNKIIEQKKVNDKKKVEKKTVEKKTTNKKTVKSKTTKK